MIYHRKTCLLGHVITFILIIYTSEVYAKPPVTCSKEIIVNWWGRAPYIHGDGSVEDMVVTDSESLKPTVNMKKASPAPIPASTATVTALQTPTNSTVTSVNNATKQLYLNVSGNVNLSTTATTQTTKITTPLKVTSSKSKTIKSHKVEGFLKTVIEMLVGDCCGPDVKFVYLNSSKDVVDMKIGSNGAVINFPVNGKRISTDFKGYPYIPLIESPAIIFLTKMPDASDTAKHVITSVYETAPILIIAMIIATIAGILMWMLDSYINYDEFPKTFYQGIWKGFWWSVVTMTTVGYGDKVPKTVLARMLAIVWAYMGMAMLAVFNSAITASLTAKSLDPDLSLHGRNVVAFINSEERNFGIRSNAKIKDVDNINDFAKRIRDDGYVQGGLIDSYVAGHYQEMLSEDNGYFTKNIYDYQFMYGFALSNEFRNTKMEKCLRMQAALREPDINKILAKDLPSLPLPNADKFQRLTTSVFSIGSTIFKETAATCAVIMTVILIIGFVWQFKFRPRTRPCCRGKVEPAEDEETSYFGELNLYENEDEMIKGQLRELEDAMVNEVLLYRQAFVKRKKDMYKLVNCEGLKKQLPYIMAYDEIHFAKYSSPDIRE